jgi:hypothetical protein
MHDRHRGPIRLARVHNGRGPARGSFADVEQRACEEDDSVAAVARGWVAFMFASRAADGERHADPARHASPADARRSRARESRGVRRARVRPAIR